MRLLFVFSVVLLARTCLILRTVRFTLALATATMALTTATITTATTITAITATMALTTATTATATTITIGIIFYITSAIWIATLSIYNWVDVYVHINLLSQ